MRRNTVPLRPYNIVAAPTENASKYRYPCGLHVPRPCASRRRLCEPASQHDRCGACLMNHAARIHLERFRRRSLSFIPTFNTVRVYHCLYVLYAACARIRADDACFFHALAGPEEHNIIPNGLRPRWGRSNRRRGKLPRGCYAFFRKKVFSRPKTRQRNRYARRRRIGRLCRPTEFRDFYRPETFGNTETS